MNLLPAAPAYGPWIRPTSRLRVLDLFAGLGGWSAAFRLRGHEVVRVDLGDTFDVELHADVSKLNVDDVRNAFDDRRLPHVVLASPPCETFSTMRMGSNWTEQGTPRRPEAAAALELVNDTVRLIEELNPACWVLENPRARLRTLVSLLMAYERRTVTYCRLGERWRKPTDLWGGFLPSLELPETCRANPDRFGTFTDATGVTWTCDPFGKPCHVYAPRGSTTSIQGDSATRAYDGDRKLTRQGAEQLAANMSERPDHVELAEYATAGADAGGNWHKPTLAALRAVVPYRLSELVCEAAERDVPAGRRCGGRATLW